MDYRREDNGWVTFLEHWWFLVFALVGFSASQIITFFAALTGISWIWCYGMSLIIAAVGMALIFYAKLPLYRERRFFTFGVEALPECRRSFYRWGYRCITVAIALLLCLLLSRP